MVVEYAQIRNNKNYIRKILFIDYPNLGSIKIYIDLISQ